ncbi:ATP-dependent Clp protease ATP-binding subunit [Raphidocelis subcapitata]|uniref:ATP-dependent Clp protease ATP-binding subunit n=1 Tax=Raphidocelis subcapitata TaxID=307507 RepID=A0A2V0P9N3_9CHLO|nr:ATP-dependent Clp protease ATP-binding subunit [Raphidocelis subcapitata]|eukprot:GBF96568.1 ATP-dependent Clp protease ATP-binding subunit [Raphidocelis subcapitata]
MLDAAASRGRLGLARVAPAHLCKAPLPKALPRGPGRPRAQLQCAAYAFGSSSTCRLGALAPRGLGAARAALASRSGRLVVRAVFEKFSERSIKAVMISQQQAKELGASEVTTDHVLLGLVAEDTASKAGYLDTGLTQERARAAVEAISGRRKANTAADNIPFSREVRKTFEAATNECKRSGIAYISPEHIMLAMLGQGDCMARRVLVSIGVDCDALKSEAAKRVKAGQEPEPAAKKKRASDKQGPKALEEFCRDLCAEVRAGKIDPVIGREREVARVMQILARRSKNNPILLGEPGVGKTAIGEGLAYAIVHRAGSDGQPLPEFLAHKRVLQLDVALLIAGAKERGELESRVTRLLAETKEAGDVVLMIDEIHTLVGAGSVGRGSGGGGGGLDVSNLVKPALARGEVQVIGATTLDEHRKYIERDAALERRFQPVHVLEPDEAATLDILAGLKERYETHHKCIYAEEALEAAVKLSHRYIADRFLPDKAIDLIDEAGSRARISAYRARVADGREADPRVQEYLQVLQSKEEAAKGGLFEEAWLLRRRQLDYAAQLAGPAPEGSSLPVVGVADVEAIVAAWTSIPVERLGEEETAKLATLAPALNARVIGQPDAVDAVAAALARARCGLRDPNRPVAALLFVGPTGVGKTQLVKALADHYYGSQDAIVRLDMSEYMERHTVSKLIGAPPGYIGYGEGGKLTEAVRRRPCAIVLFDEIEKAHPDVFNVLLQIMEDGRLTDSGGRVVSFKNAMIILTSNVGSRAIAAASSGGGLNAYRAARARGAGGGVAEDEDGLDAAAERARMRRIVSDEVRAYFRPELLNRFDDQIVFSKLGRREVRVIASIMLKELQARLAEKNIVLEVGPSLMERIIDEGNSSEYGARPLRRALTSLVEDVLADAVLSGSIPPGGTAYVDVDPATSAPRCWHGRPPAPAPAAAPRRAVGGDGGELLAGGVGGLSGAFAGGAPPPPGVLGEDGAGAGAEVYVLASGGFEDDE